MEHYLLRPYRRLCVDKLLDGRRVCFEHITCLCPTWSGDGLLVLELLFPSGVGICHLSRLDSQPEPIYLPLLDTCEYAHSITQACPRLQDFLLCVPTGVCRFTLSGTVLWCTDFGYLAKAAVWSADGTVLVALGLCLGTRICIMDGASGNKLKTVTMPFTVTSFALDPTGSLYCSDDDDETPTIWKLEVINQKNVRIEISHVMNAFQKIFCFDSAGHILACASHRRSVCVTDARGRNVHMDLPDYTSAVACLSADVVAVACWYNASYSLLYVL